MKRIPKNWENKTNSKIAQIPLITTAAYLHLIVSEKIKTKEWNFDQMDHQLKR